MAIPYAGILSRSKGSEVSASVPELTVSTPGEGADSPSMREAYSESNLLASSTHTRARSACVSPRDVTELAQHSEFVLALNSTNKAIERMVLADSALRNDAKKFSNASNANSARSKLNSAPDPLAIRPNERGFRSHIEPSTSPTSRGPALPKQYVAPIVSHVSSPVHASRLLARPRTVPSRCYHCTVQVTRCSGCRPLCLSLSVYLYVALAPFPLHLTMPCTFDHDSVR